MKKIQKVKTKSKGLLNTFVYIIFIHVFILVIFKCFNRTIFDDIKILKLQLIIFGIYTFLFIILISRDWYLYWLRKNCNHINSTKIGCISCGKKFKNGKISK